MQIVFMGSAELACPSLEALRRAGDFTVAGVVTQPDRPRGRSLKRAASAVGKHARDAGLATETPHDVNAPDALDAIAAWQPDVIVVVAYGQILRAPLLDLARRGCVNLHTSLLPAYRGAAPIQWAIAHGETETGVTTMMMNERMDAGDILLQARVAIDAQDTGGTLHDKLAPLGASLLIETLEQLRGNTLQPRQQDESAASAAPKLSKADGAIDWTLDARTLHNRVRAFNPWPCCFCRQPGLEPARLRVLGAHVEAGRAGAVHGEILALDGAGLLVQTGEDALRLTEVQPEGGRVMTADAYLRGHGLSCGERFE